jgi:hypothetical protein
MTANRSIFVRVLQCEHGFAEVMAVVLATADSTSLHNNKRALRQGHLTTQAQGNTRGW